jgi:hypothetical protein
MIENCIVACVQHSGSIPWGAIELNFFPTCFHGLMGVLFKYSAIATSTGI